MFSIIIIVASIKKNVIRCYLSYTYIYIYIYQLCILTGNQPTSVICAFFSFVFFFELHPPGQQYLSPFAFCCCPRSPTGQLRWSAGYGASHHSCKKIITFGYLVAHPTNRKWVITPMISGLTLLIPFITGVITHLLSGMSHQVQYHEKMSGKWLVHGF